MGSWNVLRVALIAIRRNLVRSGLTMLGVKLLRVSLMQHQKKLSCLARGDL